MKFALLFLGSVGGVDAHGYMANPVSRGVLQSTTPHGLGAVGPGGYINTCGQTKNARENTIVSGSENTNVYDSTRDCTSTLKLGSIFRVHVRVKAHHIGFQELRLCESVLSSNTEDTDNCHLLERADASEVDVDCSNHDDFGPDDVCLPKDSADPFKWYMSPCLDNGRVGAGAMGTWCDKFMYFKMPAGITETQPATLQWYWKTGNSCTPGPNAAGTCNYVKDQSSPDDWCAGQWPCVNCKTHPGSDSNYYDFSDPPANGQRKACSEVFTTCADVILSNNKGDTTGPAGAKDAFEGNSDLSARRCDSNLLNVVYSDSENAYSVSGPSGATGGGGSPGDECPTRPICYVTGWAEPCDPWARDAAACTNKGGTWLPDAEPEPEPTTPAPTTKPPTTKPPTTKPPTTKPPTTKPPTTKPPTTKPPATTTAPTSGGDGANGTCCRSKWGDANSCGGYSCSSGGCCGASKIKCGWGYPKCPTALVQQSPATKFSGSVAAKVSQHVNINDKGDVEFNDAES